MFRIVRNECVRRSRLMPRHVLIMHDAQGYPGRSVADALDLSTTAMKSRLHRARATVRHSLHGETHPSRGDTRD